MTDRLDDLTVILSRDIRDDDAQCIIDAIEMISGVASVQPHVADTTQLLANERAVSGLGMKIIQVIHEWRKTGGG